MITVDQHPNRLATARRQGAFTVDLSKEDPVETIRTLTGGIGAVGVDSRHAHREPAAEEEADKFAAEVKQVAPEAQDHGQQGHGGHWVPGDAPTQALERAVGSLAKADTLGITMNKNLTIRMGNCNHHAFISRLVEMVRVGLIDPSTVLTKIEPMSNVTSAHAAFDIRQPGWIKAELRPAA